MIGLSAEGAEMAATQIGGSPDQAVTSQNGWSRHVGTEFDKSGV